MKVVVIGGGPAGMMSAIYAAQNNHEVTLIERNDTLGKKLLATGNRRCNITNNKPSQELVSLIHNGRFLYSTFSYYDVYHLITFFQERGLAFIEEEDNRMYPITNKSHDVLEVLIKTLEALKVQVIYNNTLEDLIIENQEVKGIIINEQEILCDHLILASGGISFPVFGSDGKTHNILSQHNFKITNLYPCEAPLLSKDPLIKSLALVGLSLENIKLSLLNEKHKIIHTSEGGLLFTHHGLSGPAALKSAEYVYNQLEITKPVNIRLQLLNTMNQQSFEEHLKSRPNDSLKKILNEHFPKRLTDYLLNTLELENTITISQLSNRNLENLYSLVFRFPLIINKVESIKRAIVTGGGVSLKEIDSKTMKHKDIHNLSICGELLDLHGPIGGYNLTIAFLTGMMAGSMI